MLFYNVGQTLCHILEKYLKACMLMRYLCHTKCIFRRTQLKPYNQIFFKSTSIYRILKKSKSRDIVNLLPKVFLIAFSWVVIVLTVSFTFLHWLKPLSHLLIIYLRAASLHAQVKIAIAVLALYVADSINFL